MSNKDLSNISDSQFPFLIRKLYQAKEELLKWAKTNSKDKLIKTLSQEIEILKEAETRLEKKNGL